MVGLSRAVIHSALPLGAYRHSASTQQLHSIGFGLCQFRAMHDTMHDRFKSEVSISKPLHIYAYESTEGMQVRIAVTRIMTGLGTPWQYCG